jgi:mannose-6-phosphate isomerase-like protein (cupin superfamily)
MTERRSRTLDGVARFLIFRLFGPEDAPRTGEESRTLVARGGAVVEEIVSGDLAAPVAFDQDHDEWVVVLDGRAELEIDGVALALGPGEWVLLPERTPHRVTQTVPGTRWLAVHLSGG